MKKRLQIFIGSSSRYAPKLQPDGNEIDRYTGNDELADLKNFDLAPVFKALLDAGFEPCPWWRQEVWTDAESFYYSLIKASEEHDGGIFILGPDDPVTAANGKTGSISVTRDNVVFEFGMFLAAKGKERAFAIFDAPNAEGKSKLKVMSDLQGITYPSLQDMHLGRRIKKFFAQPTGDHRFDGVTIHANPKVWNSTRRLNFQRWATKGLFVGTRSSVLWDAIEGHRSYKKYISLLHQFMDKIENENENIYRKIDNIVSFRPGSGRIDLEWVARIIAENNTIGYIPVDINPHLASMAATHVGQDGLITVPFMVVDDFEEQHLHLKSIIDGKACQIGRRNLFAMLGATFSNLDHTESIFFSKMKDWMNEEDFFLFDAGIYNGVKTGGNYSQAKLRKILLTRHNGEPDYASLLANAIVTKHPDRYAFPNARDITGNSESALSLYSIRDSETKSLEELIDIYRVSNNEIEKYSHVEGTRVFVCRVLNEPDLPDLFIFREYDITKLESELQKYFEVRDSFNGLEDATIKVNRGMFLVKLKGGSH